MLPSGMDLERERGDFQRGKEEYAHRRDTTEEESNKERVKGFCRLN